MGNRNRHFYVFFIFNILFIFIASAAPPTTETPFDPCHQDLLDPKAAPVKEMGAYQTALFTGSATYSFPIDVPTGTNRLAPKLALSYSSNNAKDRTSIVGGGWSLSQSYIMRDVNHTPDDLGDDIFHLILNGQSYELVYNSVEDQYHTKDEAWFRILLETGSTENEYDDYWMVTAKDGTIYRFGYTADSEAKCSSRDYVWRYYLDTVTDTHGNHIYYTYSENPAPNDIGASYLSQIAYNDDIARQIDFILEDTDRSDRVIIFDQGNRLQVSRRLKEIQISVDGSLVSKYVFTYSTSFPDTLSFLTQIQKFGSDGITAYPPTTFEYEPCVEGWTRDDSWISPTYLGGTHGYIVADVNKDGYQDILQAYMYYDPTEPYPYEYFVNHSLINTGSGWIHDDTWAPPVPFVYDKRDDGRFWDRAQLIDVNNDGYPDLVWSSYAYINNGNGWTRDDSWITPFTFQGKQGFRVADVNNDGYPDVLQSLIYLDPDDGDDKIVRNAWINTGSGWVSDATWLPPVEFCYDKRDDGRFWERSFIVDLNGDGLPDIYRPCYGGYINNGSGWQLQNSWPLCSSIQSSEGFKFIDVNGDNLPDLIRSYMYYDPALPSPHEGFKTVALINTGRAFSGNYTGYNPNFPFLYAKLDDGRSWTRGVPFDANGDGQVDIIHMSQAWIHAGSGSSYRLKLIHNGIGGTTSITYQPTTALADMDIGFVMQCADSITRENGMTGSQAVSGTTEYDYSGGLFDYEDQEFRGFATVTETNPLGNLITHTFHQDDALKGKEFRTEKDDSSGNPYSATESDWSYTETDGVYTIQLDESRNYLYDGVLSDPKVTRTTYTYDAYGNPVTTTSLGDVSVSGDEKYSYQQYTYNTADWILDRMKHTELRDADDVTKVAEAWYYYDGHSGLDDPPVTGELTRTVQWLDTGTNPITSYTYDGYGNLVTKTDPNGNTVTYSYGTGDPTYTFPDSQTNPLGQTTSYVFDLGTGKLLSITDPNGYVTSYEYDVFGRLLNVIRPYDSSGYPTIEYQYALDGVAPESVTTSLRETEGAAGTLDSTVYYDGFGQEIQTRSESENAGQQVVTVKFYDELGQLVKESYPYFATSSVGYVAPGTVAGVTSTYDPLGRVIQTEKADGTIRTTGYDHWVRTETDENGNYHTYYSDAYDRIVQVDEHNDGETYTTTYENNARDELVSITDTDGNTFAYEYDSLGRKIGEDDPDRGIWTYTYDPVGNLITRTDARGVTTTYTYDALNRLVLVDYPDDTDTTSIYDRETVGTLSEVTDAVGTTVYTYDQRLRKIQEEREMDGVTWTTEYTYDSMDRPASMTYPDTEVVSSSYNPGGMLESMGSLLSNVNYNEDGKIVLKSFGNGLSTTYTYDSLTRRLTRIQTGGLQDFHYTYDNVGNVLSIEDAVEGLTQTFSYDDLDRLVTADEPGGYGSLAYTYTPIGNLVEIISPGGTTPLAYGENGAGPHAVTSSLSSGPLISDHITIFRNGEWYVDMNKNCAWDGTTTDLAGAFGMTGDKGITGDWDGDGLDEIGVFRNGEWYLDMDRSFSWSGTTADWYRVFGMTGDIPVTGDWNNDDTDEIGVYRDGIWYFDLNGNFAWDGMAVDTAVAFGFSTDTPVVGDWNEDGLDEIGVFRNGEWYLDVDRSGSWSGTTDDWYRIFGMTGDKPAAGDWNDDGLVEIGVFRNGEWYLDMDRSFSWSGTTDDWYRVFGIPGDTPLALTDLDPVICPF